MQGSRAKAIQQVSVDGAGTWLGHVQNILADKCTAKQIEHLRFKMHVERGGNASTQLWHTWE
jgi:hypothetical protein